jgi:hypothetical protein
MVFTFPYKLAVRFSSARTPFEVHTPENVYHTDANIKMQKRFELRRTYNQSRRQNVTQEQRGKSTAGKISTIRTPTEHCNGNSNIGTYITDFIFTMFPGSQQPLPRDEITFSFISVTLQPLSYSTASQWSST